MKKLQKVFENTNEPYFQELLCLMETQSKPTLCRWCIDYASQHMLPIYRKYYPVDTRLEHDIALVQARLKGEGKFPEIRRQFKAHEAARESDRQPAAKAAANAVIQSTFTIHVPMHALRFAYYGAAATAYSSVGLDETLETYQGITQKFCEDYKAALEAIAVADEPNPANINWKNWLGA